ncbi:isoquinoline 1-oxidoreductase, alpha subunit [Palleronia marisminoris]|uniref:Isoquinoline 1-oxidoreductase subunit alpha n=1 Tax=Palleronia marisminoris TaxID=315423 RepID=A0A1Y5S1L6_9RHOB|nr:(2Fe-2S)-binding protein [Palleronia marisminoris]SFG39663.1 isoquinoline 1-oxidoreductase, alpha subunit [Palleronia marisminoris]SLN29146.1 Isoquinoline 1-oxidoreductase subunit alpha [Palleronia marisminoris]
MPTLTVNGTTHEVDAEPDTPLLWVLREQLGLTGTKYGCGIAACGACTVQIEGQPARSCQIQLQDIAEGEEITTIEGLSPDRSHPIQQAWIELDVPQCGYCQSGQIMAAAALLRDIPEPTDEDIRSSMGNLCRCGTYNRIRAGIKRASELT